jgi:hypothetical protein
MKDTNDVAATDGQAVDPIPTMTVMTMTLMTNRSVVIVNAKDARTNQMTRRTVRQKPRWRTMDRLADRQMQTVETPAGRPADRQTETTAMRRVGIQVDPHEHRQVDLNGPPGGPPGGQGAMGGNRAGDSDTTCTDRRRAKFDANDVKLPKLPTSSSGLEMFQFGVFTAVAAASGRYTKRAAWIKCVIDARSPEELSHIA